MSDETIEIRYDFHFPDQTHLSYGMDLDPETLSLIPDEKHLLPTWTELESDQCENCPLKAEDHPRCPIAANLSRLVKHFGNHASYSETRITVTTRERAYLKETTLQEGLFSVFGVIMATSGCPRMDFLKPMARFHLPFATTEETIVRSASMYLLKQYFRMKKGKKADIELKELENQYKEVEKVNDGIFKRISSVLKAGDADQNAIVILSSIGQMLNMELSENLSSFKHIFGEN